MQDFTPPPRPAHDPRVEALLEGSVDLHCHSGGDAAETIQMLEADAAGFLAVVTKDHYYLGTAHSIILQKVFPDAKVRMFSGIVLNNA